MILFKRLLTVTGLLCAVAAPDALAQAVTITSGGASFTRPATSAFDASPTANFTGAGTGDYVFEMGWWFRVSGATQESFFPDPTTRIGAGDTSTITWASLGAGAFSATEIGTISSAAAGTGTVRLEMTITNLSAVNPLTIDVFNFIDLDVNGSAGTDNVTQPTAGVPFLHTTDTTAGFADYTGHGANAFLVRPFAATTDVAGLLGDTAITNFDNSGVPANSIDATAGMQWSLVIPASGSSTVTVFFTGNVAAPAPGGGDVPPTFSYTPPAGGPVNFTGGTTVGSTGMASIDVAIATAGSGVGAPATTTTTCTAPIGFTGFAQAVSAIGNAATTTGGPLTGSCMLGVAQVDAVMSCNENQGGTNVVRSFNLSCPAGAGLTADLAITKTDGVTSVAAGSTTTYTITASNAGPDAASPVTVADTFPTACNGVTWTCGGAGGGTCTAAGSGNINDTTVNLPAGGSVTYTASCPVLASAVGSMDNTATVSSAVADGNPGNNSATDSNGIIGSADLSITKTDNVTSVTAGGTTTYVIVASNAGPAASEASVTDTFPAACTTVSWTCTVAGGATCGLANGTGNIVETPSLPVGGSVTYTAICNISAAASGSLENTATVSSYKGFTDPNPANNSATDTDTFGAGVVGVLTANVSFGGQAVGSTSQRVLTITNTGTAPLQVTAISPVTAPFTQVAGGTCGAVSFTLAAGTQCTVFYNFNPTSANAFSQQVTITADVGTVSATLSGTGVVAIPLPIAGTASWLMLGLLLLSSVIVLRRRD